ncbi:Uncharacterised protein [Neisseria meningitidis]|uniref:Uncharacterized protein n=1 Tax=Neisseria meningitidis serogroup B (strain ATCC BAA-335 / MC58) TaxID=122586 RepID=Q9JXE4_NEIMB|nr:hypothetical protein NMB2087 [Neisseria meningitidis MC58]AJC64075.1 hypothetical protein N875_06210 [Neisseria meningitidis LNP21362]ELK76018.1 hypothetical protein NMM13255_2103 [Neisseria meningitidis M13255]ELK80949.1 hypothetical protein NMNM418_2166 [Neisseria meningitidis NM418]ELK94117.1 hypothetical protein NM9506_2036 [Neisseria meningitidis 9506]ELK99996.1 hypothetical protein NM12888_2127 [Neisseria meningitidis 12888]ELL00138.1 hypothetical protein NM4119_2030 [Neisseria menin
MATCPATAANSSKPKLPWNVLPKFAIHSIFSGEPLHHFNAEHFQRAAAAAVLADHADNGNSKHEQIQNAVACRRSLAVALRTLGAVGNRPHDAQCNHRQRKETERFVQAEQAAHPFRLFV